MISFKYLLTFLLVLMVSAEEATDHDDSVSVSTGEGPLQNYIDDETGEIKSFNPNLGREQTSRHNNFRHIGHHLL